MRMKHLLLLGIASLFILNVCAGDRAFRALNKNFFRLKSQVDIGDRANAKLTLEEVERLAKVLYNNSDAQGILDAARALLAPQDGGDESEEERQRLEALEQQRLEALELQRLEALKQERLADEAWRAKQAKRAEEERQRHDVRATAGGGGGDDTPSGDVFNSFLRPLSAEELEASPAQQLPLPPYKTPQLARLGKSRRALSGERLPSQTSPLYVEALAESDSHPDSDGEADSSDVDLDVDNSAAPAFAGAVTRIDSLKVQLKEGLEAARARLHSLTERARRVGVELDDRA